VKRLWALNLQVASTASSTASQYFLSRPAQEIQIIPVPILADAGTLDRGEKWRKEKDTYRQDDSASTLHMKNSRQACAPASDSLRQAPFAGWSTTAPGWPSRDLFPGPICPRPGAAYTLRNRRIMRYLGVSDGNMQEVPALRMLKHLGRPRTQAIPSGVKVEIKNNELLLGRSKGMARL